MRKLPIPFLSQERNEWLKWFSLDATGAKFLRGMWIWAIFPPLMAAYFTAYEISGSSWPGFFRFVFYALLAAGTLLALYKALGDCFEEFNEPNHEEALRLHENLEYAIEQIVAFKLRRCRETLSKLDFGADPYDLIVNPKEQLREIVTRFVNYVHETLKINDRELFVDILMSQCGSLDWIVVASSRGQRVDSKLTHLFDRANTVERFAVELKEPLFFANKHERVAHNVPSTVALEICSEDAIGSKGSLYVHPIYFKTSRENDSWEGLLKVVTRKKQFCDAGNRRAEEIFETLFGIFARRVEIELALLALQQVHKNNPTLGSALGSTEREKP